MSLALFWARLNIISLNIMYQMYMQNPIALYFRSLLLFSNAPKFIFHNRRLQLLVINFVLQTLYSFTLQVDLLYKGLQSIIETISSSIPTMAFKWLGGFPREPWSFNKLSKILDILNYIIIMLHELCNDVYIRYLTTKLLYHGLVFHIGERRKQVCLSYSFLLLSLLLLELIYYI